MFKKKACLAYFITVDVKSVERWSNESEDCFFAKFVLSFSSFSFLITGVFLHL